MSTNGHARAPRMRNPGLGPGVGGPGLGAGLGMERPSRIPEPIRSPKEGGLKGKVENLVQEAKEKVIKKD